jgi:hypothetical protein
MSSLDIVASGSKTAKLGRLIVCLASAICLLAAGGNRAAADGVTAYLPLNLEPETERMIERALILADEPVLKRPIAISLVELALPETCKRDHALCNKVKKYLERYSRDYAVTHASATGSKSSGAEVVLPNQHGLESQDDWEVSAQGYVQPNDYLLASAGVISYSGRSVPTGSMLSAGFNWAQLDIGYRDHWFSPAPNTTFLIGTEAPTMPSVTLSNYEPLSRVGFQYELFLAQMSRTDRIAYEGQGTIPQRAGNPKLFGAQFSIEPFSGWSLGVNRQLQYGGGGLPDSPSFLFNDFFRPAGKNQTLGKQQASYDTRFIYPGATPFAVYAQYAGQNTLDGGSYLLGEAGLIMGIDFPRLWHYFDLTYEVAEWQNGWYASNGVFLDGMTQDRFVTGAWGADQRLFGDGVGARSQVLRIGWEPPFGGYLEEQVRTLVNQIYGEYPYRHYFDAMIRYSVPWNDLTVGGEVLAGRDVFGKSFSRLSAFVRYGGSQHTRDYDSADDDASDAENEGKDGEIFVDAGANVNRVRADIEKGIPITTSSAMVGPHVAVGARRTVNDKADWGVRLELDEVDGHSLIGARPIDYRHRYGDTFALDVFAGVARYNLATPAYSLYGGIGGQWRNILPKWDLGIDFRYAQNVARNHVLPSDVQGVRPDSFYKIESVIGYISRHF